jgi:ribosomal protein L44E
MPRGQPNVELRRRFNKLRKQGKTYSEILKILGVNVPKGTLSYWSHNLDLSKRSLVRIENAKQFALARARRKSILVRSEQRKRFLEGLKDTNKYLIKKVSKDTKKLMLAMLYLGEGGKSPSTGFVLGSSSPGIVKLTINLLKSCYGKSINDLRCRVCHRADQDINALNQFWSSISGVPVTSFYKSVPDPRTIGKKTIKPGYKGVCVINCLKSTKIRLELEIIAGLIMENV